MYQAGIAAGTCCTFGSPIGAVFYAMELTSSFYMVGTLLKCLLASLGAIITFHLLHGLKWGYIQPPNRTNFEDIGLNHELLFCALLGVVCAQVAILFNNVLSKIIFLRVRLKNPFISNRWKWCLTCSLFISLFGFPVKQLHLREKIIGNMFFSEKDLAKTKGNSIFIFTLIQRWCLMG